MHRDLSIGRVNVTVSVDGKYIDGWMDGWMDGWTFDLLIILK
jgi:hypothetical protein